MSLIVIQELEKLLKQLILTRVFAFAMYLEKKILAISAKHQRHRKKHRNRCSSKQKGVPAVIFREYISVYKNYLEYISVYINYFLINDAARTSSHVPIPKVYITVYRNYFLISDAARTSSHVEYISVYINYFLINDAARTSSHVEYMLISLISQVYISVYINYFLISDAARTSSHVEYIEYIILYRNYLYQMGIQTIVCCVSVNIIHGYAVLNVLISGSCVQILFATNPSTELFFSTYVVEVVTICATDSAQ
ncbi:hypothetical protein ACJX0J_034769, partial [Zea mays]